MKKKLWFPVLYMFVITVCFSSVLIGFSRLTRERVLANEQLLFERAVLEVFPDDIEVPPGPQVHQRFNELFEESQEAGKAYLFRKDGQLVGYAVPVSGKGFWAPIRGVIGVSKDLTTITGISFYDQNETPGLGARITEEDFRQQFEGLAVGKIEKPLGVRPPTVSLSDHEVHAISGATQTCVRLEVLINEDLSAWLRAMQEGGGNE
jgi:Na+-transporting NADH:ubiquinone oxidoreductase subunit C